MSMVMAWNGRINATREALGYRSGNFMTMDDLITVDLTVRDGRY
jgi:hypothetical protein